MTPAPLTDEQRLDWLRLIRSENVGPRTFRALVQRYGSAAAALDALPDLARKGGRLMLKVASRDEALREMERFERLGARLIAFGEPHYPKALQAIDTAPPLIAVRGQIASLARPIVGIVGSRNASAAGLKLTEGLARELGQAGFIVASGLARGIDAKAHTASLATGTIAVLAGGHEKIYPPDNIPLLERILETGAVLSEMPVGWEPRGRDFPRRNRIVSGLSLGIVVVEAARRSGSLITARFALEQGREIFAVPGSPLDPRAEGPNDLIRQGATFCTKVDDILEVLDPLVRQGNVPSSQVEEGPLQESLWDEMDWLGFQATKAPSKAPPYEAQSCPLTEDAGQARSEDGEVRSGDILDLLGPMPIPVDDLIRLSGLGTGAVHTSLLELELGGRLIRHGGNRVSLRS